MKLGILGGTFDPIHNGHLFVAEEARVRFGLNKVLFIPNGHPPHKEGDYLASSLHRYKMTELAVFDNLQFDCSGIEIERSGRSYTIDTLQQLSEEYPHAEFFYIAGLDALLDIMTWKKHEQVLSMTTFIAAARPGFEFEILNERLPLDYRNRILPLNNTPLNISSTDIRARIRQSLPVRYLLPNEVVEYIIRNQIYTSEE